MRYNFPNDEQIESKYAEDLADVRLLHYLRLGPFQKPRDMQNVGTVSEFLRRKDLSGVNSILQEHLARVHRQVTADLQGSRKWAAVRKCLASSPIARAIAGLKRAR